MTKACYLILSSGRPFASHTATLGPTSSIASALHPRIPDIGMPHALSASSSQVEARRRGVWVDKRKMCKFALYEDGSNV